MSVYDSAGNDNFSTLDEISQAPNIDTSISPYLNTNITSQTLVPILSQPTEPYDYLTGKQDIVSNQPINDTYDCQEYYCAGEIALSQK